jgi:hypothetical protein
VAGGEADIFQRVLGNTDPKHFPELWRFPHVKCTRRPAAEEVAMEPAADLRDDSG